MVLHFISGMPRAGSTLLCNLLAQNPRFHATATSGILDVLFALRNQWADHIEFAAMNDNDRTARLLATQRGALQGFFDDVTRQVIFDKSRGWLAYIEMAEAILQRQVKILVPVRDIRAVLSSFEKLYRAQAATGQIGQERQNYFEWQTVAGRCDVWLRPDQPVGLALNRIADAKQRGLSDRLHLVDYDALCQEPNEIMHGIYAFLEEDYFQHDYERIDQVTSEDDRVFGFAGAGLHTIRTKLQATRHDWTEVLGPEVAYKFKR